MLAVNWAIAALVARVTLVGWGRCIHGTMSWIGIITWCIKTWINLLPGGGAILISEAGGRDWESMHERNSNLLKQESGESGDIDERAGICGRVYNFSGKQKEIWAGERSDWVVWVFVCSSIEDHWFNLMVDIKCPQWVLTNPVLNRTGSLKSINWKYPTSGGIFG